MLSLRFFFNMPKRKNKVDTMVKLRAGFMRIKSVSSLDINGVTRLVDILVYFVQERE